MKVKDVLIKEFSNIDDNKVGLLLSGGNGSASILYTLLEMGKEVHAYTFHMEDYESTDLIIAKQLCAKYDIEHTCVALSSDLDSLKKDCLYLVNDIGCKLKTDVECCWAIKNTLPHIQERVVIIGIGDDNHFCITKKAMMYYSQTAELMDEFREKKYSKCIAQTELIKLMAKEFDVEVNFPYTINDMCEIFKGTTYKQINKPKMKQWILDTHPEKFEVNRYYHAVFQKGDSKISDNFLQLLDSDWNLKGYKRTDGIYNSIGRGELPLEKEGFL